MQEGTMAASAITSPRTDWFKYTVEVTLKILDFLRRIMQFVLWHVIKPIQFVYWEVIICGIYTCLTNRLRHNYTPYTGGGMVQGKFECPNCGNRWSSGQSWANTGQKCKFCLTMVYPHDQQSLQPMTDQIEAEEKKSHLPEFCERCETLGYNCRNSRKFA